jgi:hypothetical protein
MVSVVMKGVDREANKNKNTIAMEERLGARGGEGGDDVGFAALDPRLIFVPPPISRKNETKLDGKEDSNSW